MNLTLISPACLLLGAVPVGGQPQQIGITLQHPPIQLDARSAAQLLATGGRADLANQQAARVVERFHLPAQGDIEIELAIPSMMGLGSAGMLGLSVTQSLLALHGQDATDAATLADAAGLSRPEALELHAFAQGGLLQVAADGQLARRAEIAHDEDNAWIWVLVLPRLTAGMDETLEAQRRGALLAATAGTDDGAALGDALFAATAADDISAFADALAAIQQHNAAALERAGAHVPLSDDEQKLLEIMRAHGARVCGRAPAGLALFGLIQGGGPSRELRRTLANAIGLFGGTAMGSICANQGSRITYRSEQ